MSRTSKFDIAREQLGKLSFTETVLLALSKHPDDVDQTSSYEKPTTQWTVESSLKPFTDAFTDFSNAIAGKRVLDYGCGDGFQSVAMAKSGARQVQGVEIEESRRTHARALASEQGVENVAFAETIDGEFDVVISLNAMEHFIKPEKNLADMVDALAAGGRIYLSFGPPWLAPYGAHMYFFSSVPWMNIFFSEKTVFRIRSLYRSDGGKAYDPGLNKMTVAIFERMVSEAGLRLVKRDYKVAFGLPFVKEIPGLRELLINQIDAVLEQKP